MGIFAFVKAVFLWASCYKMQNTKSLEEIEIALGYIVSNLIQQIILIVENYSNLLLSQRLPASCQ